MTKYSFWMYLYTYRIVDRLKARCTESQSTQDNICIIVLTTSHDIKVIVVKCLYDMAICSKGNDRNEKYWHITLRKDGYSNITLSKARINHVRTRESVIPYVRSLSEKLIRIRNNHHVRTMIKISNTTRSFLTKTKHYNEIQRTKNCE